MSDIVERLRELATAMDNAEMYAIKSGAEWLSPEQEISEAAAELQRLRAEVERLTRERAEAFDRAAQIARNRAKGNERLAMSHPEGSDGRRLAVERCKEADQITFAIEAERIRQAGKDVGAG